EEKKILFYYPNEVEKNEKIRSVGLCEAIVQFTRTFSPTKPAKSLHTQKNRQFFNEPEENFWMVMVVRNPIIEKHKDGKSIVEYQEEELLDKVYSSVLQQCYNMYKLFNGTFQKAMEDGGVRVLKDRLEKFFHRAMHMSIVKKESGLEQDDMRILYKYLTTSLFPRHIEPELAGRDSPIHAEIPGNLQHYGRFPKIFVNTEGAYEELHLIVYKLQVGMNGETPQVQMDYEYQAVPKECQVGLEFISDHAAMSAAVCFMIDASMQPTLEFCRKLDSIVGPQLTVLASDICEQYNINKRISGSEKEPQFKFIYFNHMNLAEKSTIHMRRTPSISLTSVHPDLMKILGDINSDFTRVDDDEEIIVKAMSDYWIVGKKSDQRELYVILNQKNANLIEVNGKELGKNLFQGLLF
ncbi:hypothetical protein JD844_019859, partial [Phrynosoma platyrhinos]